MLDILAGTIQTAAGALFMPWVVGLLLVTGAFLTARFRVVQVGGFVDALRALGRDREAPVQGALSAFQAFMLALSASLGTGNIAGVATAIVSGGPGALFWIWAYGFLATTIKFSEAVLGLRFRVRRGDHVACGPMYYLRDGLGSPVLAWVYALCAGLAALTTAPFAQANSIAVVFESQFSVPTWVSGIVIFALAFPVVIGGVTTIGRVAGRLGPPMVALYLAGGVLVILANATRVPETLALVVREAFSLRSVAGGGLGMLVAMRFGIARGIFANEAGYGTAAVAYGSARSREPRQQGLNAVMEVYIVSFLTSTVSALAILLTGVWQSPSGVTSAAAVAEAFEMSLPFGGGWVVAASAALFGYTTLVGWAYYGEQFVEYVLGITITTSYRWIYCLLIPVGAVTKVDVVWALADLVNGLQVIPNVVGLVGLSGIVAAVARDRESRSTGHRGRGPGGGPVNAGGVTLE